MSQTASNTKSGSTGRTTAYIVGAAVIVAIIFYAASTYWFVGEAPAPTAMATPEVTKEEPAPVSKTKPLPSYDRPRF